MIHYNWDRKASESASKTERGKHRETKAKEINKQIKWLTEFDRDGDKVGRRLGKKEGKRQWVTEEEGERHCLRLCYDNLYRTQHAPKCAAEMSPTVSKRRAPHRERHICAEQAAQLTEANLTSGRLKMWSILWLNKIHISIPKGMSSSVLPEEVSLSTLFLFSLRHFSRWVMVFIQSHLELILIQGFNQKSQKT